MSDRNHTEERQESHNAGRHTRDTVGRPYPRTDDHFEYNDWRTPGDFTGYGPADYVQPEDDRIMDEVNERLMQNGQLNALGINVVVSDGKVSLQGVVSNERDRVIAENITYSVPGVRRVYDRLRISGDLHSQPPTE